jgi:Domain of unknown function (DUF4252)
MKTLLTVATLSLALLIPACAQTLDINLDALAAKAKQKAEVTLEGSMLTQALEKVPGNVKGVTGNLSRLVVRHYEFDKPAQYTDADLDGIRKQVSNASGWSQVISTKEEHESVDIYMLNQNGKPGGFLLIAAEEKELTVVHVVGSIDLASLQEVVASTIHYDLTKVAGQ